MNKLTSLILFCFLISCNSSTTTGKDNTTAEVDGISGQSDRQILGEENARKQLKEALNGKGQPFTWDTLVKNSSIAIAMVEPILFDVFGKEQILEEKPYEVYLVDGYWYISGTIRKGWKGGAFEVILSAKDGRIIRLTHYK